VCKMVSEDPVPDERAEGTTDLPAQSARSQPWGFWASTGWILLIGLLAIMTIVVGVIAYIMTVGKPDAITADVSESGFFLAMCELAILPVCLGGIVLAVWLRGWPVKEYLGLTMPTCRQLLLYLGGLAFLIVLNDGLMLMTGRPVVPDFMLRVYQSAGFLPLLLVALVVCAPLIEETVFRGFLFRGYEASVVGPVGAVLFTGVGFGMLHTQYDWTGIVAVKLMGIYLGWVRLQTGSTILTMILHAVASAVATAECAVAVELMGRS
jgi:uncharacterized protein